MENYTLALKNIGRYKLKYEIWDNVKDDIIESNTITIESEEFIKPIVDEIKSKVSKMNS